MVGLVISESGKASAAYIIYPKIINNKTKAFNSQYNAQLTVIVSSEVLIHYYNINFWATAVIYRYNYIDE